MSRPSQRALLPLLCVFALLTGACSVAASSGAAQTSTSAPSLVATAAPTPSPAPTPVPAFATLTDDEGTPVTIPSKPMKIASLAPAVTETLFAIGVGDRVVATDSTSDYPAEAAPLPDVATFSGVDVERIVALGADLVIAGGLGFTSADAVAQLRSLGIPVIVVYASSVEGVTKDIELIGVATGASDAATTLTTKMRADITAIAAAASAASAAAGAPPRVFYDVGYTDETGQIYGPAEGSFLAEMIGLLGVDVITADATTYEIPLETLIERDPQVILLGINDFYQPTAKTIAKRTGWKGLTAVKNGDVRSVNDTEITRPGPRLAIGLRNLALAMYPDLTLPAL